MVTVGHSIHGSMEEHTGTQEKGWQVGHQYLPGTDSRSAPL